MKDIVERLRGLVYQEEWMEEAADEIERLEDNLGLANRLLREAYADNARLRAALEQAVDDFDEGHCVCEQTKQECIRALESKP